MSLLLWIGAIALWYAIGFVLMVIGTKIFRSNVYVCDLIPITFFSVVGPLVLISFMIGGLMILSDKVASNCDKKLW